MDTQSHTKSKRCRVTKCQQEMVGPIYTWKIYRCPSGHCETSSFDPEGFEVSNEKKEKEPQEMPSLREYANWHFQRIKSKLAEICLPAM